jgi:hypothetical protein
VLQREGKTALKLEDLAAQLGFRSAEALFEVVGKDELSLRSIEALLRPAPEPKASEDEIHISRPRAEAGGVLVVGVESLLTSLSRCCRPAPPDAIAGYVTRGKGVAVHRVGCSNLRLAPRAVAGARDPGRLGRRRRGQARALSGRRAGRRRATARGSCATSPRSSPRRRPTSSA